ncbi:hypothetical protein AA0117_g2738 [Alternaria alternata]|uniref:Uncharacterized protein n=1 Tax=Alternaria alternata TaxID=5599 RepID=A0A4Q4NPD4_ALTAL|nr:hypothetical protein AA0117_g2738 [Alternaria alternata]RYN82304.1 hypothetical protein AA0120_g9947 [Alternaria tenuissima]RYO16913.1 hypothetical protein AA0121_g6233 [Alternaria tenuissima]
MIIPYQETYILASSSTPQPRSNPPVKMQLISVVTVALAVFAGAAFANQEKTDVKAIGNTQTPPPPAIRKKTTSTAFSDATTLIHSAQTIYPVIEV